MLPHVPTQDLYACVNVFSYAYLRLWVCGICAIHKDKRVNMCTNTCAYAYALHAKARHSTYSNTLILKIFLWHIHLNYTEIDCHQEQERRLRVIPGICQVFVLVIPCIHSCVMGKNALGAALQPGIIRKTAHTMTEIRHTVGARQTGHYALAVNYRKHGIHVTGARKKMLRQLCGFHTSYIKVQRLLQIVEKSPPASLQEMLLATGKCQGRFVAGAPFFQAWILVEVLCPIF
jgi:hypothetical protein